MRRLLDISLTVFVVMVALAFLADSFGLSREYVVSGIVGAVTGAAFIYLFPVSAFRNEKRQVLTLGAVVFVVSLTYAFALS